MPKNAYNFFMNQSRDLELAIYNTLFLNDDKEMVLDCLTMYQNNDFGFSLIFSDSTSKKSNYYDAYKALKILSLVGYNASNMNPTIKNMIDSLFEYLYKNKNVVLFKPFNKEYLKYPHAKYLEYDENFKSNLFPTVGIIAYSLNFITNKNKYYKIIKEYVDYLLLNTNNFELPCYVLIMYEELFMMLDKLNITYDFDLKNKLKEQINFIIKNNENDINNLFLICDKFYLDETTKPILINLYQKLISMRLPMGVWDFNVSWENDFPEQEIAQLKNIASYTLYCLKKIKDKEEILC